MLIHEVPLHDNVGVSMVSGSLSPLLGHPQVVDGGTASNVEGSCRYTVIPRLTKIIRSGNHIR